MLNDIENQWDGLAVGYPIPRQSLVLSGECREERRERVSSEGADCRQSNLFCINSSSARYSRPPPLPNFHSRWDKGDTEDPVVEILASQRIY